MAKVKIKIIADEKQIQKIFLKAKKTLDDNIIIYDHPEVEILVMPATNKIVAMPKEQLDDEIYDTQMRMFKFLASKGVVSHDSIQAGNIFMSMEGTIPAMKDGDALQHVLLVLSKFIEGDLPFYKDLENFEKETEQALLDPEPDEYSDFDPDRHAEKKGSLRPQYQQYGVGAFYRI